MKRFSSATTLDRSLEITRKRDIETSITNLQDDQYDERYARDKRKSHHKNLLERCYEYKKKHFFAIIFAIDTKICHYKDMKKILVTLLALFVTLSWITCFPVMAFTNDISKEGFTVDVDKFFPSWSTTANDSSDQGAQNITTLITNLIPLLTTMMAVGATLMVIWWGFHMVLWGASTEQTEKWKGIMKDALIGLVLWLLAYVIIAFLWNILDI